MNKAATLYQRIKQGSSHQWQAVPMKGNRYVPNAEATSFGVRATVNGKRTMPTFKTFADALEILNVRNHAITAEANGLAAPAIPQTAEASKPMSEAVTEYLAEKDTNNRKRTHDAYTNSLDLFTESCKEKFIARIHREHLLAFKTYLKNEGYAKASIHGHFLNVMIFLRWTAEKKNYRPIEAQTAGITKKDWPPKPKPNPEEYADAQLEAMFRVAKPQEYIVLAAFATTAARSGEVGHLTYDSIDYDHSTVRIEPKPEWNWDPKTEAGEREIPVPRDLVELFAERRKAKGAKANGLIFPNRKGMPNERLLYVVKNVAKRAGIPDDVRVVDHKFRSTLITRWLRDGKSPTDIMHWIGHANLETLKIYAAKVDLRDEKKRAEIDRTGDALMKLGRGPQLVRTGTGGG